MFQLQFNYKLGIRKHIKQKPKIKLTYLIYLRKPCSEAARRNLSKAFKGKKRGPCSESHKLNLSKAAKITMSKLPQGKYSGANSWNWKGGITSLTLRIRALSEAIQWRMQVFKRDNFTCQDCFKENVYLNAHHIKEWNILFKEFLALYNQFSPIDDKETLVRLAINYTPFWDINNGKTLCKDCHSNYKKHRKNIQKETIK